MNGVICDLRTGYTCHSCRLVLSSIPHGTIYEHFSEYAVSHTIRLGCNYSGHSALLLRRVFPCKSGSAACLLAYCNANFIADIDTNGDGHADTYADDHTQRLPDARDAYLRAQ
jgi:hypothetical protein